MKYSVCKICSGNVISFIPKFELLKCTSCCFIFFENKLDPAEAKELYHKLYNEQEDYAHFKMQASLLKTGRQPRLGFDKRNILDRLLKLNVNNIVEIGAGVGIVGFFLKNKNKNYKGIELDSVAAKLANESGVDVVNSSFEYLSEYQNVDAVLAFEVLEHIDDLRLCLEYIYTCLAPGGILAFTVPNFERMYNLTAANQLKSLGQVVPPVHINFFTLYSLRNILGRMGFEVQYMKVRSFPSLQWKNINTYKKLWKAVIGKFYGSTIYCIAKKV